MGKLGVDLAFAIYDHLLNSICATGVTLLLINQLTNQQVRDIYVMKPVNNMYDDMNDMWYWCVQKQKQMYKKNQTIQNTNTHTHSLTLWSFLVWTRPPTTYFFWGTQFNRADGTFIYVIPKHIISLHPRNPARAMLKGALGIAAQCFGSG